MYNTNHNDYGWYEVGNTRYYHKIEAILEHTRSCLPIRWNYNDQIYDQYCWNQEPAQSLEDLYAARAWNIRNQYDYLVLHFSGGTDSGNILETFIKNKIPLDELLVRGTFEQTGKLTGIISAADVYGECLTQGIPLAQWAKDTHYPNLKISLVDTTNFILNYFKSNSDWIDQDLSNLSPGQAFKSDLNQLCPHYVKLIEKGKKVCHIYGADKPQIFREKNIFYTRWPDERARTHYIPPSKEIGTPYYVESFYWSPDAVLLQIKQLHTVKNYIKQHNIPNHVFDLYSGRDYENFVAPIIYHRTLPMFAQHLKDSGASVIKDRDSWFGKRNNNDAYAVWKKGIDYLASTIPKEWQNESNLLKAGIKNLWSKPRYLGK
jgi:hypothetical protein